MRKRVAIFWRGAVLGVLLLATGTRYALPDSLVVPAQYASVPGPALKLPFQEGARRQNVYSADEFFGSMPNGGMIEEIALRIDESDRNAYVGEIPNIEVKMSTSPSLAPVLSLEFSANLGPDYKSVFSGVVTYSIPGGPADGPNPFALRILLEEPFYYDPRKGALTVEFWVYTRATTVLAIDGGGASAFGLEGNVISSRGDASSALSMELMYSPIPEPSTSAVAALGLFVLLTLGGRERFR